MKNLSPILRELGAGRLSFWCPSCNDAHQILYGTGPGPRWGYNGHVDLPTFTPSIKVTWREPSDNPAEQLDDSKDIEKCCHSFVTNGQIEFLPDCTHELAGKTVPLPSFPPGWGTS